MKFVKADVTDAEQVAEAVAAAAEDAPLRVGVNCAGTGTAVRTIGKDGTPHIRSEWDRVRRHQPGRHVPLHDPRGSPDLEVGAAGRRPARRHRQHRLGGGVRRPDRPARLLRLEGRRRGHDAAGGARPERGRHPRRAPSPPGSWTPRCSACCRPRPRRRSAPPSCTRSGWAMPDEFAKMAMAIVDNDYMNGEVDPARRRHPHAAEVAPAPRLRLTPRSPLDPRGWHRDDDAGGARDAARPGSALGRPGPCARGRPGAVRRHRGVVGQPHAVRQRGVRRSLGRHLAVGDGAPCPR